MTSAPQEATLQSKAPLSASTLTNASAQSASHATPNDVQHNASKQNSRTTFYIAFAAVCLIWGSTYLGVRFAIETLPPLLMAGVRFTIAGCIMFAWARSSGAAMPKWQEWRSASIVGAMLVTFCNGAFTLAMGRVPSSLGALVATSLPIWMVLLDWLRPEGKRPTTGVMVGIALGFSGIVVLVQPWHFFMQSSGGASSHPLDMIGFALMFFGTISWAVGSIYARHATLPSSPRMTTAVELLVGGVIMLVIALFAGEISQVHLEKVSLKSFMAFLYLIVFGSIAAFSAYTWLLQNVSTALASSYTYVNPVIAMLLGATLGGESITPSMISAMMVIILAVGLIAKYRTPSAS